MYLQDEEQRSQISSGFALRVAILGGLTLAMFAVIFFRLWYLQVLSGDEFLAEANDNRIREIRVTAPRGEILDRSGKVLVGNRTSLALEVNPQRLPADPEARREELARVGEAAGLTLAQIRRTMQRELELLPAAPVTIKRDVGYDLIYYLRENQTQFPGVDVERVFVRRYPNFNLGAHLFGYVREINAEQLKEPRYRPLGPGDEIGQDGIEYEYDRYLRGEAGATRIQVDSLGRPKGELSVKEPVPGNSLVLSIDADVQAAGEAALSSRGLPAGFVVMNARNGEILGLGSSPTFNPAEFTKPISTARYTALTSDNTGAPLFNRATMGAYPTGSTFKPITAMAALTGKLITPEETFYDSGVFQIGDLTLHNALDEVYGPITMRDALRVSSDVYFYTLGERMWNSPRMQNWAHKLGLGAPTGIDLPAEAEGLIPDANWRNDLYREAREDGVIEFGETDRPWSPGDGVNLAVGQGDLQVTPLQLAVAYAAIGNGGDVVRPHIGLQVVDPAGLVVEEIEPEAARHVKINPVFQDAVLDGLHAAAQEEGGTSFGVFGGFDVPICGKTGTAERPGFEDQSWYVALAPCPDPQIVVAATFEEGGFGADTAAPAVATILSEYFASPLGQAPGESGGLD